MDFLDPDLLDSLTACDDATFAALPFGAIEFDAEGAVRRYNDHEARYSGLSPAEVRGKHVFHQLARCLDNPRVAGRFEAPTLDETLPYVMAFQLRPRRVELRLLRRGDAPRRYLLLRDR